MGEFDLIELIRARTALRRTDVALGIGDDGAVLRMPPGAELVVAMDTLVAGVHFPKKTAPEAIGWKALAVNLSDLAAMGAEPAWATLALTMPRSDTRWASRFADGFATLARTHRVALVGGDTTRGPVVTLTVQAHGFVPRGRALTRAGARLGDAIFVSGTFGDAAAGMALLERRLRVRGAHRDTLLARLERPTPRITLGIALRGIATACIDVSDGLLSDLGHVLAASRAGAAIDVDRVPCSDALLAAVPDREARRGMQLAGGDDYELCFCVPHAQIALVERIGIKAGVSLTRIGEIARTHELRLQDGAGKRVKITARGWDHFR